MAENFTYDEKVCVSNANYFSLENGEIRVHGFLELADNKKFIMRTIDDDLIAIMPYDEAPDGEYFVFDEKALKSRVIMDYFEKHDAFNCLFFYSLGAYMQNPDTKVI